MTSTSIQLTPQMQENLTQGYSSEGSEAELWTFDALAGAGAFNSNIDNMMKFVAANIEGSLPISNILKSMQPSIETPTVSIGWMRPGFIERFFGNMTS